MGSILKTTELSRQYGKDKGIHGIDLELYEGDIYGLLGPNGAGKTTFLKLITGLIKADRGEISLFGVPGADGLQKGMHQLGCMIDSADFHDYLTARQYLSTVARFYPHVTGMQIDGILERVGLLNVRNVKIKNFSTGMKMKLALAAAVLPSPRFVVLDEPTNGLDVEGIVMFRELIQSMNREMHSTFLVSSHMIHELEQLCNRVGIVQKGRIVMEGEVKELLGSGQTLESFYLGVLQGSSRNVEVQDV
ncbi:ABC transporter ATP-binding protein [Paenibacillus tuaregi]|uniref:ABC transporter ATP-binding protein n=1 Tax=Paenibacillus tuaregi TaxID=1816681 RepID=UPI000838A8E3|nr:ABC transporter ATP-binding protein [Paenibacillus tuaregi]